MHGPHRRELLVLGDDGGHAGLELAHHGGGVVPRAVALLHRLLRRVERRLMLPGGELKRFPVVVL